MIFSSRALVCAALGSLLCATSASPQPQSARQDERPIRFDGTLSVLTYNVKGLPWPIARGRSAALAAIASRLQDLRRQGRGPQIVVLQEAFTEDARAIGPASGYRYVLNGPSASDVNDEPMNGEDRRFVADARWWDGETQGKLLGSGLLLLSDYPIVAVRRMVYPAFACAGFDCLANKGALLVTVRLPGRLSPIDIVTTHLNSRNSSGVSDERSLYAYRRQIALLSAFINRWHDPSYPLIVAGDFNVGLAQPRWAALRAQIATWHGNVVRDALHQVAALDSARGSAWSGDALSALRAAKDWQFFASGTAAPLRAIAVRVPFGRESTGAMLSDHIGYESTFRLDRPTSMPGTSERSASREDPRLARRDRAVAARARSNS